MHATRAFLLLLLIFALPLGSLWAADETDKTPNRSDVIQADITARKKLIQKNLPLTETEAQAFWPMYEAYEEQITRLSERRSAFMGKLGQDFETMTDEKAAKIIRDTLEQQLDRIKITTQYFKQLEQILPGNKLLRYYQIEYQIRATIDAKIAQSIPLIH
jgi:predicted GTPase